MSLAGRTAIVTGSTKGIGRAIAVAYAQVGMRVVVNSRNEAECRALAAELRAAGGDAVPVAADLSGSEGVNQLAE